MMVFFSHYNSLNKLNDDVSSNSRCSWWWIVFMELLNTEGCSALIQQEPLSKSLINKNLQHTMSKIWVYTKPEFKFKFCSGDNHNTTTDNAAILRTKVVSRITAELDTLPHFNKFKRNLLTIDLIVPELSPLTKKS